MRTDSRMIERGEETEGTSERVRGIGPRLDGILEIYEADDECLK